MHTPVLFKMRYNRDQSADYNRSEILWIDLPDANPWQYNWEEHAFISISQDGLRWQLTAATDQVRIWPLIFASFPIHHFTPQRFSGNQYAPSLLEIRKRFLEEKLSREYLSDEFGKDFFSAGILWCILHLVVILKICLIPTIEFPYSTGGPVLIMSSPMSWKNHYLDVVLL
jgi:hypothetical protein